ncbi:cobalamin biosynthesis protein CobD/CbiB [Thalassotalea hakodatensis]|uniref:cobalamin biosynthesis protein CobD/CbiB n=1 Tax=Thalassotalea hakodatensis TaxID=3030492 RepID=UPI002573B515|nr:cobalamin biosynthesis protein [Thalassotalea hakodatensis]
MTDFINQLTPFILQLIIVLVVLLLRSVIAIVQTKDTTHFFRFYCQRLSDKVNNQHNGTQQQKIAGAAATLITLIPIIIIIWLFEDFVEVPILWHSLLLFFALSGAGAQRMASQLITSINKQENSSAKAHLQPWVLRDTSTLSSMGLCKACIEMLWLNYLQRQFLVILLYLLIGPIAAICYRILLEIHYSWNTKIEKYQYFGKFVGKIISLLQWLPALILSIELSFLMFSKTNRTSAQSISSHISRLTSDYLLATAAKINNVQLGGVALYQGHKLRRVSFNQSGSQPSTTELSNTIKQLQLVKALNIGIIFSMLVLSMFISFAT